MPSDAEVQAVEKAWDEGRVSMNAFFKAVNEGTGTTRLVTIPPKVYIYIYIYIYI